MAPISQSFFDSPGKVDASPDPVGDLSLPGYHYLPNPDPDLDLHRAFYVTTAGHSITPPHSDYPPQRHPTLYHFELAEGRVLPEFGLLLITAGKGSFESKATGLCVVGVGTALLLFPGVWHRYRPHPEVGWTERWMHFNGEMAHALLHRGIISPDRPVLAVREPGTVESALGSVLRRIHDHPAENSLRLSLLALSVISLTVADEPSALPKTGQEEGHDRLVDAALEYIWSRSDHVLSVDDVANSVGVARRTLERRVLSTRGRSVLDEIIQCRFSRAERLLRETDIPIKNIVTLAGFGSLENMRRVFVERTKLAPASYRSRFKGETSA